MRMKEEIRAFGRKGLIVLSLLAFFVAAYPFIFLYGQNAHYAEASLVGCFWPILQCYGVFLASWAIFYLISANLSAAYVLAIAFQLLYVNYMHVQEWVRKVNENWRWWQILPCCVFVFLTAALLCRYVKHHFKEVCIVFSGIFLVLCVVNLVMAVPGTVSKITAKMQQSTTQEVPEQVVGIKQGDEYPNVYYFILDEHIRSDYLYKNTGEDLSEFEQSLAGLGFNISGSSYSSATQTVFSVPNYLSFDNNFLEEEEHPNYYAIRNNLPLFRLMKEAGYSISATSGLSFITKSQYVDVAVRQSVTQDEWDIGFVALENAIPALFTGTSYEQARQRYHQIFSDFEELYLSQEQPVFTFVHLNLPHQPFIFKADGTAASFGDATNKLDKSVYLEQVRWIDSNMCELVERLIRNDPDCVILIQSDHGMRAWSTEKKENYAIINYLYYQGETVPIEGVSGVNTVRVLLNRLFHMDLEMVEDVIK